MPSKKPAQAESASGGAGSSAGRPASAFPASRIELIRLRHESMKKEIDQIREDLESEEDED